MSTKSNIVWDDEVHQPPASSRIVWDKTEAEPAVEAAGDWTNRARAAAQGALLGWSDEAEAYVRSLVGDETYDEELAKIGGQMDLYREESPVEALGLEFAGAVLSPASKVLPGKTVTSGGRLARALVEGGIAGAGAADQGDALSGAASGAAWGGAFDRAFRALGNAGRRWMANNPDVHQDLVDKATGEFTPLVMAADVDSPTFESAKGLAQGWWGRDTVRRQVHPFLERSKAALDDAKTTSRELPRTREVTDAVGKAAGRKLRNEILADSRPANVSDKDWEDMLALGPEAQKAKLRELWNEHGFAAVKKENWELEYEDIDRIVSKVRSATDDPALRDKAGTDLLYDRILSVTDDLDEGLSIKGDELMEIRNEFARAANSSTGLKSGSQQAVKQEFDNIISGMIRKKYGEKAVDVYNADKAAYEARTLFDRAQVIASSTTEPGSFVPKSLVTASKQKGNSSRFSEGMTPRYQSLKRALAEVESAGAANDAARKRVAQQLTQSRETLARVRSTGVTTPTSPWSSVAQSAGLGAKASAAAGALGFLIEPFGAMATIAGSPLVGAVRSRAGARPAAQLRRAGQSPTQRGMRNINERMDDRTRLILELLRRGVIREAAM